MKDFDREAGFASIYPLTRAEIAELPLADAERELCAAILAEPVQIPDADESPAAGRARHPRRRWGYAAGSGWPPSRSPHCSFWSVQAGEPRRPRRPSPRLWCGSQRPRRWFSSKNRDGTSARTPRLPGTGGRCTSSVGAGHLGQAAVKARNCAGAAAGRAIACSRGSNATCRLRSSSSHWSSTLGYCRSTRAAPPAASGSLRSGKIADEFSSFARPLRALLPSRGALGRCAESAPWPGSPRCLKS